MLIDPYHFGVITPPIAYYQSDWLNGGGWTAAYYPSAFHYSDKTYVLWAFIGAAAGVPVDGRKGVHIAMYDHNTDTWSASYTVGNFILTDDNHGVPAMVRDADGYIHCFFGVHISAAKYSISTNADDVTKWTARPDVSGSYSYPHPVLVGSVIYLFLRNDTSLTQRTLVLRTATPSAGIATFAAASTLIDLDADSRAYLAEAIARGTDIHMVMTRADSDDTARKHVYYFVYKTATGAIENYNGSTSTASGSLPINLTTANASYRIFDSGSNNGAFPSLAFDDNGDAHVIFADGTTPNYSLKHKTLSGGSWSSPVTIATITDLVPGSGSGTGAVQTYSLVKGAGNTVQAWYTVGGDMMRRIRSAAGTWGQAQRIAAAGTYDVLANTSVLNAHADLRVFFSENTGSSTDADAEQLKLYTYGDAGSVVGTINQTAIDSEWANVALLVAAGARDAAASFIIDEGPNAFMGTMLGNAQFDTAQTKFSQASLLLDGTGDYVSVPNSTLWTVSSGDFTFEFWFRMNETGRVQSLLNRRPASGVSEWAFSINASNQLAFTMSNATVAVLSLVGTTALTTGVWRHAAVCRSGTTTRMFLNGAVEASGTQSGSPVSNTQPLAIGRDWLNPGTRDFNGWMEEIRITRAARYTAAFTAPAAAFPRR